MKSDLPSISLTTLYPKLSFWPYDFILLKQTSSAASYSKFVSREMSKAEALLKVLIVLFLGLNLSCLVQVSISDSMSFFFLQVILSPVDSVADTYRALLPEGTPMEFQRILELKVIACSPFISVVLDFFSNKLVSDNFDLEQANY